MLFWMLQLGLLSNAKNWDHRRTKIPSTHKHQQLIHPVETTVWYKWRADVAQNQQNAWLHEHKSPATGKDNLPSPSLLGITYLDTCPEILLTHERQCYNSYHEWKISCTSWHMLHISNASSNRHESMPSWSYVIRLQVRTKEDFTTV